MNIITTTHTRTRTRTPTITSLNSQRRDISDLSMDELSRIAQKQGYDTFGMDRMALETIVGGWTGGGVKPPIDVNFEGIIDDKNANNRDSMMYGMNDPYQQQQQQQQPSYYENGNMPGWIDTGGDGRNVQPPRRARTFTPQQQQQQQQQQYYEDQSQQRMPRRRTFQLPFQDQQQYGPEYGPQQQYQQTPSSSSSSKSKSSYIMTKDTEQTLRSILIGFISGGIASSPMTYVHNTFFPSEIIINQVSQWYFDTFVGAIAAGAFAVVYRYFIRDDKDDWLVRT